MIGFEDDQWADFFNSVTMGCKKSFQTNNDLKCLIFRFVYHLVIHSMVIEAKIYCNFPAQHVCCKKILSLPLCSSVALCIIDLYTIVLYFLNLHQNLRKNLPMICFVCKVPYYKSSFFLMWEVVMFFPCAVIKIFCLLFPKKEKDVFWNNTTENSQFCI